MDNITVYCVGQTYEQWKTGQTQIQMEYNGIFWSLVLGFPNITRREVQELQSGNLSITYATIDDTLFFLFKIGEISWADAPFEPRLYEPPMVYPKIKDENSGAPLCLYIVDTDSGKLMGMRCVGLGCAFSNMLHALCREMDQHRPLTKEEYSKKIDQIYQKYPNSKDMLKLAKPENIFAVIDLT